MPYGAILRRFFARLRLALWVAIAAAVSVDAHPRRDGALLQWIFGVQPASSRPARLAFATSSPAAFYRATLALFTAANPAIPASQPRSLEANAPVLADSKAGDAQVAKQ